MADDGAHEEAVVRYLGAHLHAGGAQVQVHLVVGARDGGERKVPHAVQFQLEGQRRLQVPVDPVLFELDAHRTAGHQKHSTFPKTQGGNNINTGEEEECEIQLNFTPLPTHPTHTHTPPRPALIAG